jgi:hypothetical protein
MRRHRSLRRYRRYKLSTVAFAMFLLLLLVAGLLTMIDFTNDGFSGGANGGYLYEANLAPFGSGVVDPFDQIEKTIAHQMRVSNTNGRFLPGGTALFNAQNGPDTLGILLADVPIFTLRGISDTYLDFGFDLNQNGGNPFLSLDELHLYQGNLAFLNNFNSDAYTTDFNGIDNPAGDLALDFDIDDDSVILLNYALTAGSDWGTVFAYIPVTALKSVDSLLPDSHFMGGNGSVNNEVYEEMSDVKPAEQVPEPSTMLLLALGLAGVAGMRRKFQRK